MHVINYPLIFHVGPESDLSGRTVTFDIYYVGILIIRMSELATINAEDVS